MAQWIKLGIVSMFFPLCFVNCFYFFINKTKKISRGRPPRVPSKKEGRGDHGGGGVNGWVCCVTDGRGAYLSFGMGRWGRGGEAMGGEGESDGLKKKGRPIGAALGHFQFLGQCPIE
jgi:hypothetical protein